MLNDWKSDGVPEPVDAQVGMANHVVRQALASVADAANTIARSLRCLSSAMTAVFQGTLILERIAWS